MTPSFQLIVRRGNESADYEGRGEEGRRYSIRRCGAQFSASLIAGEGQAVTAIGRTPLYALARAESVQIGLPAG